MQIHGWGNLPTLLLRKLLVGTHLFYRSLATLLHCDDSMCFVIFNKTPSTSRAANLASFAPNASNLAYLESVLYRKFWFGPFLEIWHNFLFVCPNTGKCLKSGLQVFLSGYKVFRPCSPMGYKHFLVKRQHWL